MLSRSASYAIRALAYISSRAESGWVMNREIATELDLPPMFLTKLLRLLAGAGILESSRGRTGGFRLARPAREISLFDIVEPFDSLLNRRECVLGQDVCSGERPCPLHAEWTTSSRRMAGTLRKMTLAAAADSSRWRGGFPRGLQATPAGTGRGTPRRATRPAVTPGAARRKTP